MTFISGILTLPTAGLTGRAITKLHERLQTEVSVRKARELTRHDDVQIRWVSGRRANNLEVHIMDTRHIIMTSIN